MEFLRFLESLRTPFGDTLMSAATNLGDETVFMLIGMTILWCVHKNWGFRFLFIGLLGNVINQFLKALFLVPRPWLMDENFTIVQSAREAATGYSFPSGHTQSATAVFGTVAIWARRKWFTIVCAALILLTAFSRMYLGVHTPADVGVSLVVGALIVVGMTALFDRIQCNLRAQIITGAVMAAAAFAFVAYLYLVPAREANVPVFDEQGLKSAWTMVGTMFGLMLSWWVDKKYTRFEVKAEWWAQILKLTIGAALIIAARVGLKPLLTSCFGDRPALDAVRYFLMTVVGGALWPMAFSFITKLGKPKQSERP